MKHYKVESCDLQSRSVEVATTIGGLVGKSHSKPLTSHLQKPNRIKTVHKLELNVPIFWNSHHQTQWETCT